MGLVVVFAVYLGFCVFGGVCVMYSEVSTARQFVVWLAGVGEMFSCG